MKCPICQQENPEAQKFCGECGAKLEKTCSGCGTKNPPQYKFCGECGHNLTSPFEPSQRELSFDEKISKIQRYLPTGLTEKILSQRGKIEGERKQVTVMFCDMEGFTPMVEKLGPDDAYDIMDQVYELLIHKVNDYEGTVNEMTGDGIMALFGAPIALEDAPQRAIRSALAIHREMARFNDRIKQEKEGIPPLKMRIGIHTGPVVVGTLGNNLRVEFKAVGDTVNLASRMEGIADPGATFVTMDTFKLTEGLFRFEALGKKEIKGKEEPVNVYSVIAPSTRRTRFDVSAERGLPPLIGRERELELLLDGFQRVKTGRGQAFSIVSEAGIGKSRLLYEFRKSVTSEDVMFLEGRCLSYSKGFAYYPITDSLKANFDIREGEGDSEIRKKVKKGLKILGANEISSLPYLLELFSVRDSGIENVPLSPEARKDRIMEALKLITLKGSEIRPLILAYEDLHWADKSSEEALKYVLESIPGAKVQMIFTYRPEFVHTWGGKSYHNQVTLNRLSNRESLAMMTNLLNTEDIDTELEDLILEKTEGVPLFIEEFIKSLKDLKIIERQGNKYLLAKDLQKVTIPSTIQDVIMARVDSLPDGAKEVLQIGSVIEREFAYELIKRVTDLMDEELLSHLSVLKDSELIYERGIYPKSNFIFKHTLTREVVYNSILAKKRKKLHEKVGNAIEELYQDNLNEYCGLLAGHFIDSENYEKGAEYLKLASKKAEKAGSLNDAVANSIKRVSCLENLPITDENEKRIIDARTSLGLYCTQLNYHIDAKDAVQPIIKLALKHGYKRRLSQIYTVMGAYYCFIEENFEETFKCMRDSLSLSEELNDILSLMFANFFLGVALSLSCEFEKAKYHFERALKINVSANLPWGTSMIKNSLALFVYGFQGNSNLAYNTSLNALRIAEESGDIYSNSFAYASYAKASFLKGFFEEAKKYALKAVQFCEKINYFLLSAYTHSLLGELFFETGDYKKSQEHYDRSNCVLEKSKLSPSMIASNNIGIARATAISKEEKVDIRLLYRFIENNKLKAQESTMLRHLGEILIKDDEKNLSEAERCIKKALEVDKRNSMMLYLGNDYELYAKFFRRKGDPLKYKDNLNKAIKIYEECGADGWLKKHEEELALQL